MVKDGKFVAAFIEDHVFKGVSLIAYSQNKSKSWYLRDALERLVKKQDLSECINGAVEETMKHFLQQNVKNRVSIKKFEAHERKFLLKKGIDGTVVELILNRFKSICSERRLK